MVTYAKRMNNMKASEIRELLKVTEQPGYISFGGGLPAPELFPVQEMKEVSRQVLEESGENALQYTTTEGYLPLRKQIATRINEKLGTQVTEENIQIVSGSQQALDMTGKLFLDEGDVVVCERPTYLGAINAFRAYSCQFVEVPCDENGMDIEALEQVLSKTEKVKFIYCIPDFQNPTGVSWSIERRKAFMEVVTRYEVPVIEDNPYGEITFKEAVMPSLAVWDPKGLVISLGTFSKILCPGLRVGWITAKEAVIHQYCMIKQGMDLHTSNISQREISKFMELYDLDAYVEKIKKVYHQRRDLAMETLITYFPKEVRYTYPEGGLFLWVTLPAHMDSRQLLKKCLEEYVAYVPGNAFYPNGGGENTLRLNFSNASPELLVEGLKRLGKVLQENL